MKNTLRELFTFSSGERKGVIVLILIIILIGGVNTILIMKHPAPQAEEFPEWMNDTGLVPVDPVKDSVPEQFPGLITGPAEASFVDPNEASLDQLLRLGLGLKLSRTILNYRSAGGKFFVVSDLKKIYGMTPEIYDRISMHIMIHGNGMEREDKRQVKVPERSIIDINHADSALIETLPGIGPVLAKRIIKYRTRLGGFYKVSQIQEVYGIEENMYATIRERLTADSADLNKINLNTATEWEMARHPYLGKYVAAGIIRYRMQVTRIESISELKVNGLVSDDAFEKIKNYVCF